MSIRFAQHTLTLLGSGSSVPGSPVDTATLTAALAQHGGKTLATRARRIGRHLGIRTRHLSRRLDTPRSDTQAGMQAPDLCRDALHNALSQAHQDVAAIDYLIGHTATPHTLLPANIAWVADELHYPGPYLELRQACTGFANALQIAIAMIAAQESRLVAVVGSETGSPYCEFSADFLDTQQLINTLQMGDGAGAVLLGPDDGSARQQISEIYIGQKGLGHAPGFFMEGGGSSHPQCATGLPVFHQDPRKVQQRGRELFHYAVEALQARGHSLSDFDWIIPHQANGHIAQLFAKELGIDAQKIFVVADTLGNLGSAAIWVSLDRLRRSTQLQRGQRVLVIGAEATKYLFGGFIYQH